MKRSIMVLAAVLALGLLEGCTHGGQAVKTTQKAQPVPLPAGHEGQAKYLPEQLPGLYFGMPYDDFARVRDVRRMTRDDTMSFRFELVEIDPGSDLEGITYYFDQGLPGKPLYELILVYRRDFDLTGLIASKYGPPTQGEEWQFDVGEGFPFRAWTFQNTLVLAGAIKGTEYDPGGEGDPEEPGAPGEPSE
jgi:hypothetical protein